MTTTETRLQVVHMRLETALLKKVDDFRFKHRFETRTEAVRWLLNTALKAKMSPEREKGARDA